MMGHSLGLLHRCCLPVLVNVTRRDLASVANRTLQSAASSPQVEPSTSDAARRPPMTADDLLAEPGFCSVLSAHSCAPRDPLPTPAARLAVAAHLTERCRQPMPSDVFVRARSAADAAEWCARTLRPALPDEHVRKVVATSLGEPVEDIERRLADNGGAFTDDLVEAALPENLRMDPATFTVRPAFQLSTARHKPYWSTNRRRK
jgi:hypothetical protein